MWFFKYASYHVYEGVIAVCELTVVSCFCMQVVNKSFLKADCISVAISALCLLCLFLLACFVMFCWG